ncbi:MAG: PD-(D/E)XK nuclease family protein [Patescibacteria group bacterium]
MTKGKYPIKYWSYSSLVTYLRNPLTWHKRYVEGVYDIPATPASIIGRSAHTALQYFYGGTPKDAAIELGADYLRNVPDFEINFGKAKSLRAKKVKRKEMEAEYRQAIGFYLDKPPKHKVLGIEVKAFAPITGVPIPIKAISDLVVVSTLDPRAVDIIDHKFVDSYGSVETDNPLFMIQALFNYFTVLYEFKKPVRRFVVYECKKRRNKDGRPQLRKHVIDFAKHRKEFALFHRLVVEATEDIRTRKLFLPNPSDMFEGKDSLEIYRFDLNKK